MYRLLKDTATIADTDYPCYAEPRAEKITDSIGNDIVSSVFAIFAPGTPVEPKTRVIWAGVTYQAIKSVPLRIRGIEHHIEVYLKEVGPVRGGV